MASKLERQFLTSWKQHSHMEDPDTEVSFHPLRKWRLDFAWPWLKVSVEIQGGTYARKRGSHSRGVRQKSDFEKSNEAQRMGWIYLQFDSNHLSSHAKRKKVVEYITGILEEREDNARPGV